MKSESKSLSVPVIGAIPRKYRSFVREKAIDRARTRIIVAGNDPRKMSQQDLEVVVREEEDKIKSSIRERGLLAVLALLGLNLFG
ncbi:MAG: hypothetical protein MK188_03110 [Gammaproteobacteria bacterium]|nr:hypothetical protein [Gammaproteobacteria bacterium]